jgi:hypothetical protein
MHFRYTSDDNNKYNVVTRGILSGPSFVHFIKLERVGWYMKHAPLCMRQSYLFNPLARSHIELIYSYGHV